MRLQLSPAAKHEVSVLVFPELSLSGYQPDLATELAMTATDSRLTPLRSLARQHQISAVVVNTHFSMARQSLDWGPS